MAGSPNSYGTRASDIKAKQPMEGNGNSHTYKASLAGKGSDRTPDPNGASRVYRAQTGGVGTKAGTGASGGGSGGGHGMVGHHSAQTALAGALVQRHFRR
jgi:hypothetical protein